MAGPLKQVASSFWPTARKKGVNCSTMMSRRDVGAGRGPGAPSLALLLFLTSGPDLSRDVARLLGLHGVPPRPQPSEGVG